MCALPLAVVAPRVETALTVSFSAHASQHAGPHEPRAGARPRAASTALAVFGRACGQWAHAVIFRKIAI